MKKLLLTTFLVTLISCGTGQRASEKTFTTEMVSQLAGHWSRNTTSLDVGQWTKYSIMRPDGKGEKFVKKAVVGKEDDGSYWVESTATDGENSTIFKFKVDAEGNVRGLYLGKPGEVGKKVEQKESSPASEAVKPKLDMKEEFEVVDVPAGKFYCTKVTTTLTYKDGTTTSQASWLNRGVPFWNNIGGRTYGGFVRMEREGVTVELIGYGSDAEAELEVRNDDNAK